jgi:hypothetical protein
VVHQRHRSVVANLGEKAHLGVGRSALDQRPAGVVADAAEHRRADAGGADYRMRFAPERAERLLERVERGAGQADHLPPPVDQVDAREPAQADEHDLAVVVVAPGRRAADEAGVGGLEDDDASGREGSVQHAPVLDQAPRPHNRRDRPSAIAKAACIAAGVAGGREHMARAHDPAKLGDQAGARNCAGLSRAHLHGCMIGRGHAGFLHLRPDFGGLPLRPLFFFAWLSQVANLGRLGKSILPRCGGSTAAASVRVRAQSRRQSPALHVHNAGRGSGITGARITAVVGAPSMRWTPIGWGSPRAKRGATALASDRKEGAGAG